MTYDEAAERRTLVRQVRAEFRPHFFSRCLEIAYRVIPCCESCEYNNAGICSAPILTFGSTCSGLTIKDGEALCLQWSPSPEAIIKVLQYAYIGNKPQDEQLQPVDESQSTEKASINTELIEQIRILQDGKITVAQAAQNLGISTARFYAKAKKIGQSLSVIPRKKPKNEKYTEQIRRFHAGEISASEAAQNLGISKYTFYAKAREVKKLKETAQCETP